MLIVWMRWKAGLAESCSHVASVLYYLKVWTKVSGRYSLKDFMHEPTNWKFGRFLLKFWTFRDVHSHFHITTRINDFLGLSGKEEEISRYLWLCISHNNKTKVEAARNDMPLEEAGTELANPGLHLDALVAKSHKALHKSDQEANRKQQLYNINCITRV